MSFKDKYKKSWKVSTKREIAVKNLLATFGDELIPYGFEAESTEYNPNYAKESGIPDYKVKGEEKYIEVTGTDSIKVKPEDAIWVRPDKVQYAVRHPDQNVILVHVLDHLKLFRCINMLDCQSSPIIQKLGNERFHIVQSYKMETLKEGE